MITYEWSDWRNGTFWWIQSVYVAEPFRGSGIFKALFQHVQNLSENRDDVCGLRLYVDADNARAQEVYKQMGLKPTEYLMFEQDRVLK
jgi:ribosomal protein S18 acetylase RimI-like enzyme